jgi:Putative salt-induced outer membrane protein
VAIGLGSRFIDNERTKLTGEIGPGYRRARTALDGEVQSSLIGRGLLDLRHQLTGNTELFNTLLVESGKDNTFAQNDFGVSVAMNERFALKAGLQARHNTEVEDPATRRTDTLTTVNLVYNFR